MIESDRCFRRVDRIEKDDHIGRSWARKQEGASPQATVQSEGAADIKEGTTTITGTSCPQNQQMTIWVGAGNTITITFITPFTLTSQRSASLSLNQKHLQ